MSEDVQHFFSVVRFDADSIDGRSLFRHTGGEAYVDHSLMWRLFPGDADAARDFLFRAERDESGWPSYYVVSARQPVAVPGLLRVASKPYAPVIEAGDRLHFRLRANPTEATATALPASQLARYNDGRAARGLAEKPQRMQRRFHDVLMAAKQRHPLADEADANGIAAREEAIHAAAIDWLTTRLEANGLRPLSPPQWSGYLQHRLRHRKRVIQFSTVDYEGLVEVTDPTRCTELLLRGLGRAKGFGCGLMLVRRMR